MLKKPTILMMQGLIALLPLVLTFYLLFWFFSTVEEGLTPLIPDAWYFPGLGLLLGMIGLLIVGMAVNAYIIRVLIRWSSRVIGRIPVVKTIYGAIQDAVNLVNIGKQQKMQSVVSVTISESIHLIGFVTSHEGAQQLFKDKEKVGVYIPLSYQIGGYTLYIDKDKISPLDIDVETAMRISLTGGTVANLRPPETDGLK